MSIKFNTSEFQHVFRRIYIKKDKHKYCGIRQLNKFHKQEFEQRIESIKIKFENLRSLAQSDLANRIRFLKIAIPDNLVALNQLCYASPTYFPNIRQIEAYFEDNPGQAMYKFITIRQPLFLMHFNLSCISKYNSQRSIRVRGNYDITIIDSSFNQNQVWLENNNNITIKNTSFVNSFANAALHCLSTRNKIFIESSIFKNSNTGLSIYNNQEDAILRQIQAENCKKTGVWLGNNKNGAQFLLQESEVLNCRTGIYCGRCIVKMKNCVLRGCWGEGLYLFDSTLYQNRIYFRQNEQKIEEYYSMIFDEDF